jgi:hypothetical protein
MAWATGDLITATKLNSENGAKYTNYYEPNDTWGTTSVTSAWHYIHHTTGRFMYLATKGTDYWWATGTAWFEFMNSSGTVTRITLWSGSDTTDRTISQTLYVENYSFGPGWYRGYAATDRGWPTVNVYWGQSNCWRGGKLVYWDNPTSSGNKIAGTKLTAAVLNSGRVGVI